MALKYWSTPITRSGKSTLVPEGPWHYGLNVIAVHALGDKELLSEATPKPLEVDDGQIWFYIADIVSVSEKHPELNVEVPDLLQYREATVFIKVRYEGKTYAYCPFMWVDKDLPLMRGFIVGFPKKIAYIELTKLHPQIPYYNGLREGISLGGFAIRSNYLLFKLKVKLERKANKIPLDDFGPWLLPRYLPEIGELKGVNELVTFETEYLKYGEIWEGKGEVIIGGGLNDEVELFKPVRILKGYYYSVGLKPKKLKCIGSLEL